MFFINYSVLLFNIFNFLRHRDKIGISANFPEFQSHNFQSRSRSRSERKGFCRDSIQNLVISRKFWKYIFILQFSLYKRGSSSPKTILVPQLGLKMDPGTGICCGDFFYNKLVTEIGSNRILDLVWNHVIKFRQSLIISRIILVNNWTCELAVLRIEGLQPRKSLHSIVPKINPATFEEHSLVILWLILVNFSGWNFRVIAKINPFRS